MNAHGLIGAVMLCVGCTLSANAATTVVELTHGQSVAISYDDTLASTSFAIGQSSFGGTCGVCAIGSATFVRENMLETTMTFQLQGPGSFLGMDLGSFFSWQRPVGEQFAISMSRVGYLVEVIVPDTGQVVARRSGNALSIGAAGTSFIWADSNFANNLGRGFSVRFAYTNFVPGNYAVPSSDPTCASTSCMEVVPARDPWAGFSVSAITQAPAVPEPGRWALMLVGLTTLLTLAARRQGA